MKIILNDKIDESLISFESDIGWGIAVWEGNKFLSRNSYEVELEIDGVFEWGMDVFPEKEHVFRVDVVEGFMWFKAKVISCEDDGVLVLSLGNDIVFIEVSGVNEIDGYISFYTSPDKVLLYPVEL